jgi:hypothetical protein
MNKMGFAVKQSGVTIHFEGQLDEYEEMEISVHEDWEEACTAITISKRSAKALINHLKYVFDVD